VIYQIYPRSFQDSTGDGTGDLRGITRRIPYLRWLGVDAVWISPFYRSPMADFGYDVADHRDVDPLFGTLADFDALVAAAHDHGIRVIVDYVPNHTSDQHPWFLESRRSRDSAKRGWYLWRDPAADGGPPNNWLSNFGGPAWTWDEATGQFYGHAYLPEQPDLDWHHPGVRSAMLDVLRFWLDRGVDGFRLDALRQIGKDRGAARQSAEPPLARGRQPVRSTAARALGRRPRDARVAGGDAARRRRGGRYGARRRAVRPHGAARRLLRNAGSAGVPDPGELPSDLHSVGSEGDRRADPSLRVAAAPARLAELGARKPRQTTARQPGRRRPRPRSRRCCY
jgi:glycosidase